jgi:hypothetical protein
MPNHTSTILTVSVVNQNDYLSLLLIREFDIVKDVQNIILEHFISLGSPVDQFMSDIMSHDPHDFSIKLIDFNKLHPIPDYSDWYNWCCEHWGNKWGAYEEGHWDYHYYTASIFYMTAWSPSTPFYVHISTKYPNLSFKQQYVDEGGGFLGYNIIHNENIIEEADWEWNSKAGILLRQELGVFSQSDDENDEE